MCRILAAFGVVVLVAAAGCRVTTSVAMSEPDRSTGRPPHVQHIRYALWADHFDAELTWSGYDPERDNREEATFLWNGEDLGSGRAGFARVTARLGALPDHATVFVYNWRDSRSASSSGFPRCGPFSEVALVDAARGRGHTIIFSSRDYGPTGEVFVNGHALPRGENVFLGRDDEVPPFDHCLTWQGYSPDDEGESVVFEWDGEDVGHGKEGRARVFDLMFGLPEHTSVLVFPYDRLGPRLLWGHQLHPSQPVSEYGLDEVRVRRALRLIYSPRDDLEELCRLSDEE